MQRGPNCCGCQLFKYQHELIAQIETSLSAAG
jgi:hypothetical protein